jgi:hypothetical protein
MIKVFDFLQILILPLIFFSSSTENAYAQDLSMDTVYVISEKYTTEYFRRKEAKEDIANGYVFLFKGGWLGVDKKVDSLSAKYGFKIQVEGCTPVEGREFYNDEVMKYLNKRNGESWWERFLEEQSKLNLEKIPSLPEKETNQ